jgi:hypothetical protein
MTALTAADEAQNDGDNGDGDDDAASTLAAVLTRIRSLDGELADLYGREAAAAAVSSYTQQVINLLVVSDCLRAPADRLCKEFTFQDDEEEEKEPEVVIPVELMWACALCTLENPEECSLCEVCGSPRPKGGARPPPPPTVTPGGADHTGMLHDVTAFVGCLRFLADGTGDAAAWPGKVPNTLACVNHYTFFSLHCTPSPGSFNHARVLSIITCLCYQTLTLYALHSLFLAGVPVLLSASWRDLVDGVGGLASRLIVIQVRSSTVAM